MPSSFNVHPKPFKLLPPLPPISRPRRPIPETPTEPPQDLRPSTPASSPSPSRPIRLLRRTLRVCGFFLTITPIVIVFTDHVVQTMFVRGPSMTPYLNENFAEMHTKRDLVLVYKSAKELKRGMVVTFPSPTNPSQIAIKRIIGLPGDRVTTRSPCSKPSQIVPWNHIWVEGDTDDPRNSLDSNTYGPISMSLVCGRVTCVLWPRPRLLRWGAWGEDRAGVKQRSRVQEDAVRVERPPEY